MLCIVVQVLSTCSDNVTNFIGDDSSTSNSSSQRTSSQSESDSQVPTQTYAPSLKSYKLVGDNIDKEVRPRDMRSDHQTRSLHYFHTYGVRDRVDLSDVSDKHPMPELSSLRLTDLLPNATDEKNLLANFSILVGRVLKKRMPFFSTYAKGMCRHIQHEFYTEMSQKSGIVSTVHVCVLIVTRV